MSREVKRVPLDFAQPINEIWPGYLGPVLPRCEPCNGVGYTGAGQWVQTISVLLGQLGEDIPRQFQDGPRGELHPYLGVLMNRPTTLMTGVNPWAPPATIRPTADILDFLTGLTGQPADRFTGPLANPGYEIAAALIRHAGLPEKWGWCPVCDGTGTAGTPEERKAADEWARTDPPAGDGWQLWETVSEGSPITPVFATPEELAAHIASPQYAWHHPDRPISLEQATALVNAGWAPSGASLGGKHYTAETASLALNEQEATQ
jgi:hypothetical protein